MTYNRTLKALYPSIEKPTHLHDVPLSKIWLAGALGGVASWIVSAPSELIKCRVQLAKDGSNSLQMLRKVWVAEGLRGLYRGGVVTLARDSIGYGFYFAVYGELKRKIAVRRGEGHVKGTDILLCGGIAGIATWVSIYPLDVIKTRIQAGGDARRMSIVTTVKVILRKDGAQALYRGLGACSLRAFIVNAFQVGKSAGRISLTGSSGIFMKTSCHTSMTE